MGGGLSCSPSQLLKFVSKDFNTHGGDIEFLSVYGAREKEILYPPVESRGYAREVSFSCKNVA
jgi:hypothetical protein